jgi:hypothetical protein
MPRARRSYRRRGLCIPAFAVRGHIAVGIRHDT